MPLPCERPRLAFFPFGAGSRLCLGEPFARLEILVVLSRFLQRFDWAQAPATRVRLRPSIVLEPRGGLRLRLGQLDSRQRPASTLAS